MKRTLCTVLIILSGVLSYAQGMSDEQKELLGSIKTEVAGIGAGDISVVDEILCFQKDGLDYFVSVENYGETSRRPFLIVMYSEIYYGAREKVTRENVAKLLPELNKDLQRVKLILDDESLFVQSEMSSNNALVVGRMLFDIGKASAYLLSDEFSDRVVANQEAQEKEEERREFESSIGSVQMLKVPSKDAEIGDSVSFNMIFVEGSPERGICDFWIGETEVVQKLWVAMMGNNPSCCNKDKISKKKENYPVENVSFDDVVEFIDSLNAYFYNYGYRFRIPAKREWLYAAQGGKESKGFVYSGSNDLSKVSSEPVNKSNIEPREVKSKKSNELKIYDMSGNVMEICSDKLDNPDKIYVCGGSIQLKPDQTDFKVNDETSQREIGRPNPFVGFRLVMDKIDIDSK